MYTKVGGFSRCAQKHLMDHGTQQRPFLVWFVITELGLVTFNNRTKFEGFISTRYENMNGHTKCGKWGGLGKLG